MVMCFECSTSVIFFQEKREKIVKEQTRNVAEVFVGNCAHGWILGQGHVTRQFYRQDT